MIESLMKNFHLPTDTLRTTLTPFSSRLNDQSINQKDDKIIQIDAVALKWMIESLMKIFHLPTGTLRITSTPFSSRLNHQSIKEIRLRIARILNWAESEVLFLFLRAAQPTQIQSFSTNIRPSFKTRPSHSLPQSAEHPIEHTHD